MIRTKWSREKKEYETFIIPAEEAKAFYTPLADGFPMNNPYCMSIDTYEAWKLAGNAGTSTAPCLDVPPEAMGWWNPEDMYPLCPRGVPCKYCHLVHLHSAKHDKDGRWIVSRVRGCEKTRRQYRKHADWRVANGTTHNWPV